MNADLIADGLSPFRPERAAVRAGRLMLQMMASYVERGESFAFETTLAGRNYARSIRKWRSAGYEVVLYFLSLGTPEAAISRVAARVDQGGHAVPEDVVRRRFWAGFDNFEHLYKPLVDSWRHFDSSGERPVLVDWSGRR